MTDLLSTLASLSLGGSAAIGLLALAARFSRSRYAARWRCWVWLLLCLRLALPVSIALPEQPQLQPPIRLPAPTDTVLYTYQPVIPSAPPQSEATHPSVSSPSPLPAPNPTPTPDTDTAPSTPKQEFTLFQAAAAIWSAGVAGMLGWFALSHLRFLRYLRRWSRPVSEPGLIRTYNQIGDLLGLDTRPGLHLCTGLNAPMLAGLFHPVLLLPEDLPEGAALRYSLLHELTHYKRRDIWLKTLALWVNALHWFNPCMWYMMRLVDRDMELACDEAALKTLPREEHSAYGKTILDAVERLKTAS